MIIIPAYTHIDHRLFQSIAMSGIPYSAIYGVSDLPKLRSIQLSKAMLEHDRVIMIDSDVIPTPQQIQFLAETQDVCIDSSITGIYPLKCSDKWSVHCTEPKQFGMFEVQLSGLGFFCVSSDLLLKVSANLPEVVDETGFKWYPFCLPIVENGIWYGEDFSFCKRLKQAGSKILSRSDLIVGHVISKEFHSPVQ